MIKALYYLTFNLVKILKDGEDIKSFFVKISIFYIFFPVNNLVDINDGKYIKLLLVKRLSLNIYLLLAIMKPI